MPLKRIKMPQPIFTYIFTSIIPSKKNSKRIIYRGRSPIIISSQDYLNWEKIESLKFKSAYIKSKKPLDGKKFIISYNFYSPNKRKYDLSNKIESINDMIVSLKLIKGINGEYIDDNYEYLSEGSFKYLGVDKSKYCEVKFYI